MNLSCSGAPIFGVDGRLLAVLAYPLSIPSARKAPRPDRRPTVNSAHAIEERFFREHSVTIGVMRSRRRGRMRPACCWQWMATSAWSAPTASRADPSCSMIALFKPVQPVDDNSSRIPSSFDAGTGPIRHALGIRRQPGQPLCPGDRRSSHCREIGATRQTPHCTRRPRLDVISTLGRWRQRRKPRRTVARRHAPGPGIRDAHLAAAWI